MIRYTLACNKGHQFESWFQSADAFDTLLARSMVSCAVCGSEDVKKTIMAPRISKLGDNGEASDAAKPLSAPASVAEQAIQEFRKKVEASSEDVGTKFASEARKIHHGEAPERPIMGEARLDEAKALIDEGISVAPLPFLSKTKTN